MKDHENHVSDEKKYSEPLPEEFLFDEEESEEDLQKRRRKTTFLRIIGLAVAVLIILQGATSLFNVFSRDSIELARISESLSELDQISELKDAVVTIQGEGGRGTGFAVHPDGYILTNHHVIHRKEPLAAVFSNGDLFHASVIKSNEELDVALLKVEGTDLPYLPIRLKPAVKQESIYVIGNPLSQSQIVGKGKVINDEIPYQIMKLSASIYPGHSGSPVLSEEGEVIGIVYARTIPALRDKENSHGLAVPMERVVAEFHVLKQLMESY
ncbi:trypsin-like peptidase domain-containing protein [bacterium LRH843]|nr:trypsin-like peptidase domain-containing protein [bacterium LRH843]